MAISQDTFFLDPGFQGSLQSQIQQIVASAILSGQFRLNEKMPSSRKLAKHLGVSRITVTLAYNELVADDYLSSVGRSGYYISQTAPVEPKLGASAVVPQDTVKWDHVIQRKFAGRRMVDKPENWRSYPFPFVYGQADPSLFSQANWRMCAHQALGLKEFDSLTSDYGERDDPELISFIARHTLPRRGIQANPDQILVTVGAQNALWIIAQILLKEDRTAAFENPGYPGLRDIIDNTGCRAMPIAVDHKGLPPDLVPSDVDIVFTTPSHHAPTTVTMPMDRRHAILERAEADDFLIVEDDYEFEMSFLTPPSPALKSLDANGRVIYVGSFSKSLFPGLRLGYLVGSAPFIEQARALRSAVLRHPPGHMQRTTAHFLALGHYDALVRRMRDAFHARRTVMDKALRQNKMQIASSASFGGSSFWIRAPEHIDSEVLADNLRDDGVLIEPGTPFFAEANPPKHFFRLAYSSIPSLNISMGIKKIAERLDG